MKGARFHVLGMALLLSCGDGTGTGVGGGGMVASVSFARDRDTINALGFERQPQVTIRDGSGELMTPAAAHLAWSTSDDAIAAVDAAGRVTAIARGDALVIAAAGGHGDTITMTVRQVVASLSLTPAERFVLVGDTATFSVAALDSNARAVPDAAITWSVAEPSVASIASGLTSALTAGVTVISASTGSMTATANLTVQNFQLVKTILAPPRPDDPSLGSTKSGYWMGDVAGDFSRVVITPYLNFWGNSTLLTFFTEAGEIVSTYDVVGGTGFLTHPTRAGAGAVAMTPDGARTVVGSDDGHLYVYAGMTPFAAGIPVAINGFIRAAGISPNGRYAAAGARNILNGKVIFTLHDLSAPNPISPIHFDTTAVASIAFSADNRYVAYCGSVITVFDLERRERVFRDPVTCNAIDISRDGQRIVAATGALSYYTRSGADATWALAERVLAPGSYLDLSVDGRYVAYGGGASGWLQNHGVSLYALGEKSLIALWTEPWSDVTVGSNAKRGQITTISLRPDGNFVVVGTEGGEDQDGGQLYIYDRAGRQVFFYITLGRHDGLMHGRWNQVTFARISDDGTRAVVANHGGVGYFFRLK